MGEFPEGEALHVGKKIVDAHEPSRAEHVGKKIVAPPGFKGDGFHCQDVDECGEKLSCWCPHCSCKNTWGGFVDCKCKGNLVCIKDEDTCIGSKEHVGVQVAGDHTGSVMPRRRWRLGVHLLQVQAQAVHGFRNHGDHVTVHSSGQPEKQEPTTEGGGRATIIS